jgi:hypothetical protein
VDIYTGDDDRVGLNIFAAASQNAHLVDVLADDFTTLLFAIGETGYLIFPEQGTAPPDPTSDGPAHQYLRDQKMVFQYNDGGTVRYKYLDLTGTGVTWVHTTTPP